MSTAEHHDGAALLGQSKSHLAISFSDETEIQQLEDGDALAPSRKRLRLREELRGQNCLLCGCAALLLSPLLAIAAVVLYVGNRSGCSLQLQAPQSPWASSAASSPGGPEHEAEALSPPLPDGGTSNADVAAEAALSFAFAPPTLAPGCANPVARECCCPLAPDPRPAASLHGNATALSSLVPAVGLDGALDYVESLVASGELNDCHHDSHPISQTAMEIALAYARSLVAGEPGEPGQPGEGEAEGRQRQRTGKAAPMEMALEWTLPICRGRCKKGCLHGITESATMHAESKADVENVFRLLCLRDDVRLTSCAHGIGHALAHRDGMDDRGCARYLGDAARDAYASEGDDGDGTAAKLVYYCTGGMYMEWFDFLGPRTMPDADRVYYCLSSAAPSMCFYYGFRNQKRLLHGNGHGNGSQPTNLVSAVCNAAELPPYDEETGRGTPLDVLALPGIVDPRTSVPMRLNCAMGLAAAYAYDKGHRHRLSEICCLSASPSTDTAQRDACIVGWIMRSSAYWREEAGELCASLGEAHDRTVCEDTAGRTFYDLTRDKMLHYMPPYDAWGLNRYGDACPG